MNYEAKVALIAIFWSLVRSTVSYSLENRAVSILSLPTPSSTTSFFGAGIQFDNGTNPPSIYATAPKRNFNAPIAGGSIGAIYKCTISLARGRNNCSATGIPTSITQENAFPLSFDYKDPTFRACSPLTSIECGRLHFTPGICYKSDDEAQTWSDLNSHAGTCPIGKVDLVFLLDGSHSVGEDNFGVVKNWTSSLASRFRIEQGEVQVGVIQYSHFYSQFAITDPLQLFMKTEVELGKYSSIAELKRAISKISLQKYSTYTAAALNKTVTDFKKSYRWRDPSTSKVLILLTDGNADDADKLEITSNYVRSLNIVTFAIGVGNIRIKQLRTIATGDKSSNERVYSVNGFYGLNDIISTLTSQIANVALEGNSKDDRATAQTENLMAGFSMDSSPMVDKQSTTKRLSCLRCPYRVRLVVSWCNVGQYLVK